MKILINGKQNTFNITNPIKIANLPDYLKTKSLKVVVEKNSIIIDNLNYDAEEVNDDDVFEIIQFVGGG